ncbi:MAG: YccT family protein [Vibrionaceae bacterium]
MRNLLLCCLLSLLWVNTAYSAMLFAENGVELLVVNGKKIDLAQGQSVALEPGLHQLVVRFDQSVRDGSRNTLFTSNPYIFDLQMPNRDMVIAVPLLRTLSHANAFFRAPKWQLRDKLSAQESVIAATKLTGSGLGSLNDIEKVVQLYNEQLVTPKVDINAPIAAKIAASAPSLAPSALENDTLTTLKSWYLKANADEKKAFMEWIATQKF